MVKFINLFKDINNGSGSFLLLLFISYKKILFFVVDDGCKGFEFWIFNGGKKGIKFVVDIYCGEEGLLLLDLFM